MTATLDVAMRVLHIVSMIFFVGGLSFAALVVRPVLSRLDATVAETVRAALCGKLKTWVWIGVVGLLVSGVYNWIGNADVYKAMGPVGNALIGTKVLLAVIIFALYWMRQSGMLGAKAERPLMMVIIHLAAIVLILAGVLRYLRLEHLGTPTA